jgi:hypothetical protein
MYIKSSSTSVFNISLSRMCTYVHVNASVFVPAGHSAPRAPRRVYSTYRPRCSVYLPYWYRSTNTDLQPIQRRELLDVCVFNISPIRPAQVRQMRHNVYFILLNASVFCTSVPESADRADLLSRICTVVLLYFCNSKCVSICAFVPQEVEGADRADLLSRRARRCTIELYRRPLVGVPVSIRQHTSASVSIRQRGRRSAIWLYCRPLGGAPERGRGGEGDERGERGERGESQVNLTSHSSQVVSLTSL